MAYIEGRPGGFLVVWRDAETRKKTSRLVTWSTEGVPIDEFDVTKEQARDFAEKLREEKRLTERAYRKPLERVLRHNAQDNPAWAIATDFIDAAEEVSGSRSTSARSSSGTG